jgi:PAS domain S-box-containing protein
MLRIILTLLCLTIGPPVLAQTRGIETFDSGSSHVVCSLLQASMLDDLPRLALFALAALLVVGLVAAQRKSTASLRRSRADLEDKVRDLEKLNAALQVENAERERAEKRARETERELQATIDMIPVKITVYRADGARHSVNRPWRDYTGLSQEDIEGKSWAIIPHPDDLKASEAEWKVRLANREPFQAEMRLRRRDGEYLAHMVHRVPLRDQTGEVVKWYAVAFDIEDRKRAEDALRQSEASLAEAQRLSRTGSFGWDVSSGDIVWSEESYRIFGYDPATAATIAMVLDRVHPDDVALVREVIERATSRREAIDFEHRLLMPDGSIKHLNVVAYPMTDERGELRFVGAVMDITERVRGREMLQRVQADFAHAARMSMLGELTASIAHEVNQPLAAIAINGEVALRLLNRSEPDLADVRELAKSVVADARRAADVIARVRTMATRQAPEQTLLSVDEVIGEALQFLRHEVQSHGLTVTHHSNPAAPKMLGDRTQLQQVFVNLMVNAIQAMAQMGATGRTLVVRTTLSDPSTLCCTLEDSGPGIKPEHLDHLFDSFFTTKDGGIGLGLPISRSIIEAHGGHIRADNESVYGGARFSCTFPAKLQQ